MIKRIGIYTDPIINKQYSLYSTDAKTLSDNLKEVYSKFHNIPNVEDFKNHSKNSPHSDIMKYENNFISIMTKGGQLEDLTESILIDGYRRLFMSEVPEIDVFVKVYDSNDIVLHDEIKLMMEFNYWKKFNYDRSSFFERGFSLWVFLKNGVTISTILEELQIYLYYKNFFNDGEGKHFETLFFDNLNLFDDIKFIYELKHQKATFSIGKKEYKDFKFPIPKAFIEKFGMLRFEHKKYNKVNIDKFYSDLLDVDSFKGIVVEYNEASQDDKRKRCLDKSLDFLTNYIKSEYFGFERTKTVIEIQEEFRMKLEEIKKKHSTIRTIADYKYPDEFKEKFFEEIKDVDEIIWVNNIDMKELNTQSEIHHLKFIKTVQKEVPVYGYSSSEPISTKSITKFLFKDIDTGIEYVWKLIDMKKTFRHNQNFYILKDKTKVVKTKRPEFVIFEVRHYGKYEGVYLIKAKTGKRVVEIANASEYLFNINYSYLSTMCCNLSTHEKALEATKDLTEGIIIWKEN